MHSGRSLSGKGGILEVSKDLRIGLPHVLSFCPQHRGILPPGGRRFADPSFEGAVEGVLGFVTYAFRDFRQAVMILTEQLFGKVDAPAGQVAHWGLPDQLSEPTGQDGT